MPDNQPKKGSQKPSSVLITGGTGLVGKYLSSVLSSEGFNVSLLSRNTDQADKVRVFTWDPEKKIIDPSIFEGVDYIINLAGANIGQKRWTKREKRKL